MGECGEPCEVFSRIVGYFRPVARWNDGKSEEFKERKMFDRSAMFDVHQNGTTRSSKIQQKNC